MSAAYITTTDVDALIGTDVRQALFTTPTVAYSSTHFDRVVELASALVKSAAKNAGYTLGDTSTDELVKLATLAEFIKMAPANRKGIKVGAEFVAQFGGTMEAIRNGSLPLAADPDLVGGVGGATFSATTGTASATNNVVPPIFSRFGLRNY